MAKSRKKSKAQAQARPKSAISPVMIGAVVAAALILVGGLIILGNQSRGAGEPVDVSQFPTMGDAQAPVTMIEFSDYG